MMRLSTVVIVTCCLLFGIAWSGLGYHFLHLDALGTMMTWPDVVAIAIGPVCITLIICVALLVRGFETKWREN
jgi:uncharacterized membrane protein